MDNLRKVLRETSDTTPAKVATLFKTGPGDYAAHDQFMGITVPTLRKIAKKFCAISLADLLPVIQSTFNEERLLALIILTYQYSTASPQQQQAIYQFYCRNLPYVNNWNLVDSSAHLIIGAYLFRRDRSYLVALARSHNIWARRIAIIATWYFIRQNELDWTFILSQLLCHDHHDLIHKAVGWMLREAGKKDEKRLIAFLRVNAKYMPKTMLRSASERLSKQQKTAIMLV
jgi:3-methyladenine DNA glycosylase AlkD